MTLVYRLSIIAALLAFPAFSNAQTMDAERITSGLSSPLFVTHAPGDPDRLFIVQRGGQIRIYNLATGTLNAGHFITVPGVQSGGEQGLLGLAFHPDYQTNGFFYVYFTDNSSGDTRVQRFARTTADTANAASAFNLIEVHQPQSNNNGGWLGFGHDGYLYVGLGDGGGANDNGSGHTTGTGNSQDITNNLLGKVLRLDVDGDDFVTDPNRNYAIPADNPFVGVTGDDEIFLYGLRNPWRCSFDRLTGDLWIGDVGQGAREEIDVYLKNSIADRNYGWRLREGTIQTPSVGGSSPADGVEPVYDYPHSGGTFGGFSTTGGYVYRGPITDLQGLYFFGDYISSRIWSFRYDGSTPFNGTNYTSLRDWTNIIDTDSGTIGSISSFGEDLDGNLYIVDLGGEVFKVTGADLPFECSPGSLFPEHIFALDRVTFGWNDSIDIELVELELSSPEPYTVIDSENFPDAIAFPAPGTPPPGLPRGFLIRPDCSQASWSSGGSGECQPPGSCPPGGRDGNLPAP